MYYATEIKKAGKWQFQHSHTSILEAIEHIAAHSYYPDYLTRVVRIEEPKGQWGERRETVVLDATDINHLAKVAYERNKQAA